MFMFQALLSYLPAKIPLLEFILKHFVKEDIFITKSVREIVWGYDDPLLEAAKFFHLSNDAKVGKDVGLLLRITLKLSISNVILITHRQMDVFHLRALQ